MGRDYLLKYRYVWDLSVGPCALEAEGRCPWERGAGQEVVICGEMHENFPQSCIWK